MDLQEISMGAIGGAERYLQGKMPAKSSIVRHFQGRRRGNGGYAMR